MEVEQNTDGETTENKVYEMIETESNKLGDLGTEMGNLNLRERLEEIEKTIAKHRETLTAHITEITAQNAETKAMKSKLNNIKDDLTA